jgi:hypothetical protein
VQERRRFNPEFERIYVGEDGALRKATVYVLHFERALDGWADRHYVGWTTNVSARLTQHLTGEGAEPTHFAFSEGIRWVATRWPGLTVDDETRLQDHHFDLKPYCEPCRHWAAGDEHGAKSFIRGQLNENRKLLMRYRGDVAQAELWKVWGRRPDEDEGWLDDLDVKIDPRFPRNVSVYYKDDIPF